MNMRWISHWQLTLAHPIPGRCDTRGSLRQDAEKSQHTTLNVWLDASVRDGRDYGL
jgi:hypothetical protein